MRCSRQVPTQAVERRAFFVFLCVALCPLAGLSRSGPLANAKAKFEAESFAIAATYAREKTSVDARFTRLITRLENRYREKALLDELIVTRRFRQSFEKTPLLNPDSVVKSPEGLRSAQERYLASLADLRQKEEAALAKLTKAYLAHLGQLKKDLTKSGDFEQALAVKSEIEKIGKRVDLSPPPPPDKPRIQDELLDPDNPTRLAAAWEWVNPEPEAARVKNGGLELMTLAGTPWTTKNDLRNFPVRELPARARGVEVEVEIAPTERIYGAGIVLIHDQDHYVSIKRGVAPDGIQHVVYAVEDDGEFDWVERSEVRLTHLRLRYTWSLGLKTVSAWWCVPGEDNWKTLGKVQLFRERPVKVALFSHIGSSDSTGEPIPARFTRFRFLDAEEIR